MEDDYFVLTLSLNDLGLKKDEIVDFALTQCACTGIEEFNLNEDQVDLLLGVDALSGQSPNHEIINEVETYSNKDKTQKAKFYFTGENSKLNVDKFEKYLKNNQVFGSRVEFKKTMDWNEEWRKHFSPIEINGQIIVYPSWMVDEKKNLSKHVIVYIYPGQGFGTGGHETTFLCLSALCDLKKNIKHTLRAGLDFGCGSGILGISALLMGLDEVDFYDIDDCAIENTFQNIDLNFKVEDQSKINVYNKNKKNNLNKKYDLVFANILLPALIEEHEFLYHLINIDGFIILSGILNEQCNDLLEIYNKEKFEIIFKKTKGDWSCLVLKRVN